MLVIDGSYGEGGGQILRTALALAALTKTPIKIINVRKGRCDAGLKTQHLEACKAMAKLASAKTKGLELGSTEIEFYPNEFTTEKLDIDISTAGSVGLVLQPLFIACMHLERPIEIEIRGGATNGKWAQPALYAKNVFLENLKMFGYKAELEIKRYGYFPKGGSNVIVKIEPSKLKEINLTKQAKLEKIEGVSHASKHLEKALVAERQAEAATDILKPLNIPIDIKAKYTDTLCAGSALDIWAKTSISVIGFDALGELRKKAEKVGEEAARGLTKQIDNETPLDEYMEDQIIPFMAFSAIENKKDCIIKVPYLTEHTKTNIWVVEQFLPVKFIIDKEKKTVLCKIKDI